MEPSVGSLIACWSSFGNVAGSRREASNAPIRRTCWPLFARCAGWNVWGRRCVTRSTSWQKLLPPGSWNTWTPSGLIGMRNASAIFACPKIPRREWRWLKPLGEMGVGCWSTSTQKRAFPGWPNWKRSKRCGECGFSTIMRASKARPGALMTNCLPQRCSSRLPTISKPVTVARRARPGRGTRSISPQTCEDDEPHFMVAVVSTDATTADGSVIEELHADEAAHEILPHQHLVDTGYVDADVLAGSQMRYQVDLVGPVIPDTSWASKAADRFEHSDFLIDWQAKRVVCPAGQTSRDWGHIPDRHGKPSLRVRFPLPVCRTCSLHDRCTQTEAYVLILRPDEQTYTALQKARKRQETPEFRALYAKRAGIEGTVAQAVRTCEMRRARYIGSNKLRLQAFFTATAMNMLRACAWLANGTHASTPVSRFSRLVSAAKSAAAA